MLNKESTGQILICEDNEEFLKLFEDIANQYLAQLDERSVENE